MNEIEKLIKDKTFFTKFYNYKTGDELITLDGKYFHPDAMADSEVVPVPDEFVVKVEFNEKVIDRINKYGGKLVSQRGIKDTDDIDEKDNDVKRLIADAVKANKGKQVSKRKVAAIIEQVKRTHKPHFTLAIFQVVLWSMLYDMFKITNRAIECKIEVEIPEDYWNGPTITDPLDQLLDKSQPLQPDLDKNNALEYMIAVVTQFLADNKELNSKVQELIEPVLKGMRYWGDRSKYSVDDAGFLNTELDRPLSEELETNDNS